MIIGFTGTREGMTAAQAACVQGLLAAMNTGIGVSAAHHGDCVGADAEFDKLARFFTPSKMHIHPSNLGPKVRANCYQPGDVLYDPKPPLARNQDIVNACDILIAAPYTKAWERFSGSWATVNRAVKGGKPFWIVAPDGSKRQTVNI